jgi:hypothetical protein
VNVSNIITTVAGVLIGLPAVLNAIPNLDPSPEFNAMLAVGALIGGIVLKQQTGGALSESDVRRIAAERERLRRIRPLQDMAAADEALERQRG